MHCINQPQKEMSKKKSKKKKMGKKKK